MTEQFENERLAVRYVEHSHSDKPKSLQNLASSSFLNGAYIVERRYKPLVELLEDLASLTKKQGRYIKTWGNGTEEYSPSYYDDNDVDELVKRAFDLLHEEEL